MLRRRLYVISSVSYILLGCVIGFRSVMSHVDPLVLLGAVFVALGAVRLRDMRRYEANRDS